MSAPWPLSAPPRDYELGHVRAVLPDRVLDDARVVVRDGRVVQVTAHPPGSAATVDGGGALCLPGLVDVHSDVLGREAQPRPGVALDGALALASATARLRAVGVTTAFHGLAFQARTAVGLPIGSPRAEDLHPVLATGGASILHRVDVRCVEGIAAFEEVLAQTDPAHPPLVSHEDHTPGQGQYADPAVMERWLVRGEGMDAATARRHVRWWRDSREELDGLRDSALARLGELARAGRIRLMGHDPQTVEDVRGIASRAGAVAEFPTTMVAARAAREAGLLVVAGAPNVVRGASHAGNVSAAELVAEGLVDALASDYLPISMLASTTLLAASGLATLPQAVAMVTSGAASVAGRADPAALVPGAAADVLLVDDRSTWPEVVAVLLGS